MVPSIDLGLRHGWRPAAGRTRAAVAAAGLKPRPAARPRLRRRSAPSRRARRPGVSPPVGVDGRQARLDRRAVAAASGPGVGLDSARSCWCRARRLDAMPAAEQVGQQIGPGGERRRVVRRPRQLADSVLGRRAARGSSSSSAAGELAGGVLPCPRALRRAAACAAAAAPAPRPPPASSRPCRGCTASRSRCPGTAPRASASRASSRAGRPMRSPGAVRYQYRTRGASPGAATWSRNVFSKPRRSAVRRRYGTRRQRRLPALGRLGGLAGLTAFAGAAAFVAGFTAGFAAGLAAGLAVRLRVARRLGARPAWRGGAGT